MLFTDRNELQALSTSYRARARAQGHQAQARGSGVVDYHGSGIAALNAFAVSLQSDLAAVRAALALPWSNGIVEGHVNRLKLLKRQSYGRASFDLLRQRVLAA